jgi:hypothetical protein
MDYKYAMENQLVALTPYENFLFALKAKEEYKRKVVAQLNQKREM